MSKLKEKIRTPVKLAANDYPGQTEQSYLVKRLESIAATLPAGERRNWFIDPTVSVFERAHAAGISLSRHRP